MAETDIIDFFKKLNWDKLYPTLKVHAIKRLSWAGMNPQDGLLGMDPNNIVSDAVISILEGTRKPKEKDLKDPLKYICGVMNSIISNVKTSKQGRLSLYKTEGMSDEEFFENVCYDEFNDRFEKDNIISIIEKDLLERDPDMYLVFIELAKGNTHKEIADSLLITVSAVENIHKRINTFLKKYIATASKTQT